MQTLELFVSDKVLACTDIMYYVCVFLCVVQQIMWELCVVEVFLVFILFLN